MWSNSSRCRQESVYLSRTWYLYTWSCLDNLIIIRFSINCSTVICSPTIILMLSWEKPLVKPMARWSIFHHISFWSILFCNLYLPIYIIKIPKIFIISIRSHFCKWPWRDWKPLYRVGCEVLIYLCRYEVTRAWSPTGLIPWFSKTEGNTYATLLHHPFLFKGKPTHA